LSDILGTSVFLGFSEDVDGDGEDNPDSRFEGVEYGIDWVSELSTNTKEGVLRCDVDEKDENELLSV
jgi:hypothetical protein